MTIEKWMDENTVNLIGHSLTIIGIIVGVITVVWQLGRQHRDAILVQRDNAREALKLKIHETIIKKIRELNHANVEAAMYAFNIPFKINSHQEQLEKGIFSPPLRERATNLAQLHYRARSAVTDLIEEFEAWSIAFPGIAIFQLALNSSVRDADDAFQPLYLMLLRALPLDPPEEQKEAAQQTIIPAPLSPHEIEQLQMLVERYKEAMDETGCYVHDLTVESQNKLLSEIFDEKVPLRQPLDPKHKVITTETDAVKELTNYFENDTAWGKTMKKSEADVKLRIAET